MNFGLVLAAVAAVALDRLLGEPRRFHPLVGFGALAGRLQALLNPPLTQGDPATRLPGLIAWMLAVLPFVLVALWLRSVGGVLQALVDVGLLYLAIGARSLSEHAQAVSRPLAAGDLAQARARVGWMVSRDTTQLDDSGVAKAATESVLENGNDAVFGALFWFFLLGGPGALLFRLANTLDAMWGYRTPRLRYFGWAAARIDDLLNFVPARLTALSYALCGFSRAATARALACWRAQAKAWDSPNAGPVMAAGAGALGVALGGAAIYHGEVEQRPPLGEGAPPAAADIDRAVALVQHALWLWLAVATALGLWGLL
ncbi:Cobalamin biosynthesis protein CbiB [Methyloversatilis universalis FAM5]|uniref:Cobalamin biosynthesis protein CobD n=1 Tax=Methyloversatilis universalis (strain ATCC BAA-1314 / DSM 25237 / JCM 13912 / CCUG 52030 / FAM5) TaxID=1000565 RepID=F5RFV3_METUF|nr:adenosylcobinamide-phosphate synthase CbiB [Methyloversatilis universalis]EGK70441.1 Cobalamin biosynthesis protein CbiB [Methyloversatilis universalis FAM5]